MQETWRWFGPDDPVSLENVLQAGASGVVTALHHVPAGEVWPLEDVLARKHMIEAAGLVWSVAESIPVHSDIKARTGDFARQIENYKQSIRNVAAAGVGTVCYNFMPVLDWTRTSLDYELPNAARALSFDMADFAAYDVFILRREGAADDYDAGIVSRARKRFEDLDEPARAALENTIIAGLPGGEGSYGRDEFRAAIARFGALGEVGLRANLLAFLEEIIPVAEAAGVRMCIHPDDPPFSLFGLPRVVSTAADARVILDAQPSPANGLTLCAGSFGARGDNDLIAMVKAFGPRIHFVHLRNVSRGDDGSFYEAEHLGGDTDMTGLVGALLAEEKQRRAAGRSDASIPMRPDHGHLIGDERDADGVNPGYSFAGRLKGLAELRGVIHALTALDGAAARD